MYKTNKIILRNVWTYAAKKLHFVFRRTSRFCLLDHFPHGFAFLYATNTTKEREIEALPQPTGKKVD